MKRLVAMLIIFAVSLFGCSALDVVQKDAVRAFGDVLASVPAEEYEPSRWKLTAPDGGAWFAWDNMNFDIVVDAAPFAAAGADLSKLENCVEHNLNPGKESLSFSSLGFDMLNQNVKDTAMKQFAFDISCIRDKLGYHEAMEHYNLDLDGAVFEWAKDIDSNDKDIVFVLNPDLLIAAGADPEKVEGWIYAQVSVHIDGKPTEVWKFLKPINLE